MTKAKPDFDYSQLGENADLAREAATQIQELGHKSIAARVAIGELLIPQQKKMKGKGLFKKYVEEAIGMSLKTAKRYMHEAILCRGKVDKLSNFAARALEILTEEGAPEGSLDRALERAERGEWISIKLAEEIKKKVAWEKETAAQKAEEAKAEEQADEANADEQADKAHVEPEAREPEAPFEHREMTAQTARDESVKSDPIPPAKARREQAVDAALDSLNADKSIQADEPAKESGPPWDYGMNSTLQWKFLRRKFSESSGTARKEFLRDIRVGFGEGRRFDSEPFEWWNPNLEGAREETPLSIKGDKKDSWITHYERAWSNDGLRVIKRSLLKAQRDPVAPGLVREASIDSTIVPTRLAWLSIDRIPSGKPTEVHKHSHDNLLFIIKGRYRVRWGEMLRYIATASAGDFVFVPSGAMHQELSDDEDDVEILVVRRAQPDKIGIYTSIETEGAPTELYWEPRDDPDPEAGSEPTDS